MDYLNYQQFIKEYSDSYQLDEYTAIDTQVMGIMGESGELIECLKKQTRDGNLDVDKLQGELGDVLAYLSLLAGHFGISFSVIDCSESNYDLETSNVELCKRLYNTVNQVMSMTTVDNILAVFYCLEGIAQAKGLDMDEVSYYNYQKLLKRWGEGKQRGWGDFR